MSNILDAVKGILSVNADDEPKSPMHVGEVMNAWTYHTILTEANRFAEMALNTTRDDELIKALNISIQDCQIQADKIETLLKNEGISIPDTFEKKPKSDPDSVPAGAKMTDDEIANGLVAKQIAAITFCTRGLIQSIRTDLAGMWLGFFLKRTEYNAYYMPLMRKRGWIKVPPYYYPPGMPKKP